MLFELVATVIAGAAGGGLMLLVNRLLGRRLPKWLIPAAAGCAMIAATISSEYGWYGRTTSVMPERVVVIQTVENKAFFRPWTYVKPFVHRFMALDRDSVHAMEEAPSLTVADLLFFGRWQQVQVLSVVFDCAQNRQSQLPAEPKISAQGELENAVWHPVASGDKLMGLVCGGA